MVRLPARPATTVDGLPEWDARWSRILTVRTADGPHTFHLLDTLPALREAGIEPTGTIVAVHGNPTWSYMWRRLAAESLRRAGTGTSGSTGAEANAGAWRVVAVDQLEMGYSERLEHDALPSPRGEGYRRLAERVGDLDAVVHAILPEAPSTQRLVTIGHDWGGVISLGWATRNTDLIDAVISCNTAVHQPESAPVPAPLQAALAGGLLPTSTVLTDAFLRVSLSLSESMDRTTRRAFRSPYRHPRDRGGIGAFVADIPVDASHPSDAELQRIGADIAAYEGPALLLWGPKDPVFLERYLRDLRQRLPQADLHRFEKFNHLFTEDVPYAGLVFDWLEQHVPHADTPAGTASGTGAAAGAGAEAPDQDGTGARSDAASAPAGAAAADTDPEADDPPFIFDALAARGAERAVASVDMTKRPAQAISWAHLAGVVDAIAKGLGQLGLQKGDRVSLLVTPGNNLTAAAYAVLKAGGVAVVADAGLGPAGMTRAIKSADPQWIIGEAPGLALARGGNWPGRRISVSPMGLLARKGLRVETSLTELSRTPVPRQDMKAPGRSAAALVGEQAPGLDDDAAILFTSGSTGPAKGVRYTHRRLGELIRLLGSRFHVERGSGLVAGFAPFALFGPGLGATSVTPDMSVTKPRTLRAAALADAISAADCTMAFASPAAWTNVVATADELDAEQLEAFGRIDLVLSAGAPVPLSLMDELTHWFPRAQIHSPYGMTEGLLLTDIDRDGVAAAAADQDDHGVCVGTPIPGVHLALAPLDSQGVPAEELLLDREAHGKLGEFVVSAPHIKAGYDNLWKTDEQSKRDTALGLTWHRTNDIGHIDTSGRVWLEGRVQHVITAPAGPVGPGGIEAVVDELHGVTRCAAVGVGPVGTQAIVVVLEPTAEMPEPGQAPLEITEQVRYTAQRVLGLDVAAVLVPPKFPTDIRHNSKIDRSALADWAASVLAGGPVRKF
nr:alpha/beta fold hydrolase [Brevibacterium sp. 91QC2O2]